MSTGKAGGCSASTESVMGSVPMTSIGPAWSVSAGCDPMRPSPSRRPVPPTEVVMRLDEFLANRDAYRSEPDDGQARVRNIIVNILESYYSDDGESAYNLLADDDLDELGCCDLSEIGLRIVRELRSFLLP